MTERWESEYRALVSEREEEAESCLSSAAPAAKTVQIAAKEREEPPATSAIERARNAAGAFEYFLANQEGEPSEGGFQS